MIHPTIGRKVYFYDAIPTGAEASFGCYDRTKPFDATVIYVWGPNCVNLDVTDHAGNRTIKTSVPLGEPAEGDQHNGYRATWMPFQVGQAKAAAPAEAAS